MINIIGAGLAGLSAAMTLAERGIKCALISAQNSERAQSVLAEGGINAALDTMGEGDTTELHFEETMLGGVQLADPIAVRALTENAPDVVRRLASLGVPFNRNPDGSIMLRSFGGQKKKRTAFAQSSTGKMIMTSLIDEVRKYEARGLVTRFPHHTFVRLLTENGECTGVRVSDNYTGKMYDLHGTVITAGGGLNGFFPGITTGTVTNTGNITAVMFAQGVKLANLEMIQYHPTTIGIPGKRCLISEAARGEGGRLFSEKKGDVLYFMEERYPELGNLMPRDVVSREMFFELRDGRDTFLDMTGIPADTWKNKLSDLRKEVMDYMILDPAEDPIPVEPGIHYFMGGIYTDPSHRTSMPGLFAAGECACIYHGANRLGGNSMLGAVFGGMTAARSAAQNADKSAGADCSEFTEKDGFAVTHSASFASETCRILSSGLGIVRNESGIKKALAEINALPCANDTETARKAVAQAMLYSALGRTESRGAHFREDFPETLVNFRQTTVSEYNGGTVCVTFDDIPERKTDDSNDRDTAAEKPYR